MSYNVEEVRSQFPALGQSIGDYPLVYLDSGATTLKPLPVVNKMSQFYLHDSANVHRGAHTLSDRATLKVEESRKVVKEFLNAADESEIIFTRGTTDSINLLSSSFGQAFLKDGDEVLISEMEHHSNIVPWQLLRHRQKIVLKVIPVLDNGELDLDAAQKLITSKTKLVSIVHCSNSLGTINPVAQIVKWAHAAGAKVHVDGAQSVGIFDCDIASIGCDFFSFSAHKLFGPFGIGVLYGKKELLAAMPPYQGGGSMISRVTFDESTYMDLPYKFEAGTPHVAGIIGMGEAIRFLKSLDIKGLRQHEDEILKYATRELLKIEGLRVIGEAERKANILSFVIEGIHHSDIGHLLDKQGIAVRAGHHCCQPIMQRFSVPGTVRASFSIYTNEEDIFRFYEAIKKVKEFF